ncbi:MAG: radical SAM family heme chaperone HemW [Candidatus Saganbacteria bacterium]|nr:radical SAM family heme chaperone HemW [Candidatus Saganbacteria bacterium]
MTNQNPKSKIQNPNKVESLYIHIPFCKQKCNYCDFVSYAGKEALIDEYVTALINEIQSSPLSPPPEAEDSFPSPLEMERGGPSRARDGVRSVTTIYFGGGTPTLLEPKHFEKILGSSAQGSGSRREISIESNPGTADLSKLKALRSLGINRLSIGCQSFNDKHLKTLGRIHTAKQAIQFVKDARAAGFDNINLDLMFALPNQTLEEWKEDLATALSLGPEHISVYNLQIEEGTPFWELFKSEIRNSKSETNSKLKLPNEDMDADMYEYAIDTLKTAGYHHYEISNFAKPGFECQHNIAYWKNQNYLGIGAGAHSHVNGKRWANPNCIEEYIKNRSSDPIPVSEIVVRSLDENRHPNNDTGRACPERERGRPDRRETIFMGLRLLDGIPIETFKGFEKELNESITDGLLVIHNNNVKLTRRGLMLANVVFERFI